MIMHAPAREESRHEIEKPPTHSIRGVKCPFQEREGSVWFVSHPGENTQVQCRLSAKIMSMGDKDTNEFHAHALTNPSIHTCECRDVAARSSASIPAHTVKAVSMRVKHGISTNAGTPGDGFTSAHVFVNIRAILLLRGSPQPNETLPRACVVGGAAPGFARELACAPATVEVFYRLLTA